MNKKRVGILSGSFDPVHAGHISMALQAMEEVNLDEVYFVPEIEPRRKNNVTHFAHRVEMLKLATTPHHNLKVLELPDKCFTTAQTLPRIRQHLAAVELFFICGSDMLEFMPTWPLINKFLTEFKLIVGVRADYPLASLKKSIEELPVQPDEVIIFNSSHPNTSSHNLRQSLLSGLADKDMLDSTRDYIERHGLYGG